MQQGDGDEDQTEGCGDGGEVRVDGVNPLRKRGGHSGGEGGKI